MQQQQGGCSRALYHCNYCNRDISQAIRVRCAVCHDYDLCLACFATGCESYPHKRQHAYKLVDRLHFPLFNVHWGADEEVLLLEAAEMYGLGKWGPVADHVGTKTEQQCMAHYYYTYVDHAHAPKPRPSPLLEQVDLQAVLQKLQAGQVPEHEVECSIYEHMQARLGSISRPALPSAAPSPDLAEGHTSEAGAPQRDSEDGEAGENQGGGGPPTKRRKTGGKGDGQLPAKASAPGAPPLPPEAPPRGEPQRGKQARGAQPSDPAVANVYEVTGYNVKRHEFDPEYDNDAELAIAEMEFREEDTEEDVALKLQMLEVYDRRLMDRESARDFVVQRGLLNVKRRQAEDKKRSHEERHALARFRVFAQFMSDADFSLWLEGLNTELKLRTRIQELKEMRQQGCRSLADWDALQVDRRRKAQAAQAARAKAERQEQLHPALHLPAPPPPPPSADQHPPPSHQLPPSPISPFQTPVLVGSRPVPAHTGPDLHVEYRDLVGRAAGAGPGGDPEAGEGGGDKAGQAAGHHAAGRSAQSFLYNLRQKRGVHLDVTMFPGYEVLSGREVELCAALRIVPAHYLVVKHSLMKEYREKGRLTKQEVRNFFRLEPSKAQKIFDLLQACQWVNAHPDNL